MVFREVPIARPQVSVLVTSQLVAHYKKGKTTPLPTLGQFLEYQGILIYIFFCIPDVDYDDT